MHDKKTYGAKLCQCNREALITVAALMASGILDSSLQFHIQNAKNNGITREEMTEALTQLAFYAGWPKAWAALRMAKEVYGEE